MPVLASMRVQVDRAMKDPISRCPLALAPDKEQEKRLTGYVCFVFGCICNSIGSDYTSSSNTVDLSASQRTSTLVEKETHNAPKRKTSITPNLSLLGSCSLLISRIGKASMDASVRMLMIQ